MLSRKPEVALLQPDRDTDVVRRLIGGRECKECRARALDLAVRQFEAVEAAACEKEQVVAANGSSRAQLAGEFPALPKQPALGIAAPFAGAGKLGSRQG